MTVATPGSWHLTHLARGGLPGGWGAESFGRGPFCGTASDWRMSEKVVAAFGCWGETAVSQVQ